MNSLKIVLILTTFFAWTSAFLMRNKVEFLGDFLLANELRPIQIYSSKGLSKKDKVLIEFELAKRSIYLSEHRPGRSSSDGYLLYIFESIRDLKVTEVDTLLKDFSNKRLILLQIESYQKLSLDIIQKTFENLTTVSSFLWIDGPTDVLQVMKLGHHISPLVKKHEITQNILKLRQEILNLQGIHLKMVSLPWYPYIFMNCSEDLSVPCECSGFSIDYVKAIAESMNFTIDCFMEPSGIWGTEKLMESSKGTNGSMHLEGLMENIFNENYDLAPPVFISLLDRHPYVDIRSCHTFDYSGVYFIGDNTPKFNNPFVKRSFLCVMTVMGLTGGLFACLYHSAPYLSRTLGYRIYITIISLCFTVVNIYYQGTLTMLSSTNDRNPFQSLADVISDPLWSIIFMKEAQTFSMLHITQGGGSLQKFRDEVRENADIFLMHNISEGLYQAKHTKKVFFMDLLSLRAFLDESSAHVNEYSGYYTIGRVQRYHGFMFRKDSPWPELLQPAIHSLAQGGITERIKMKALGKSIDPYLLNIFFPVNLQHTMHILMGLLLGKLSAVVVLCIEKYIHSF